jgi:hypothetical protein
VAEDRDKVGQGMDQAGDPGERFLSRWSRRKRQARPGLNPPEPAEDAAQAPERVAEGEPQPPPALTDADMPPVESLDESSDFAPFLSPGVSEQLRKRALRKLFGFSGFNFRDGLDDYDDDYTVFEPLGNIITADMRAQFEREARRRGEAELAPGDAAAGATETSQRGQAQAGRAAEADSAASTTGAETDPPSAGGDSQHG